MTVSYNFPESRAMGIMKAGHAFTIEPMISEGSLKNLFEIFPPFLEITVRARARCSLFGRVHNCWLAFSVLSHSSVG